MGLVCWENRGGSLHHWNGVKKGRTAEDEVQEGTRSLIALGFAATVGVFWVQWEGVGRFDRGEVYSIGSYRILLAAVLQIF